MLSKSINYINVSSPLWENKSEHRKKNSIQRAKLLWHRAVVFPLPLFFVLITLEINIQKPSRHDQVKECTRHSSVVQSSNLRCVLSKQSEWTHRMRIDWTQYVSNGDSKIVLIHYLPFFFSDRFRLDLKFYSEHIRRFIDETWLCKTWNFFLLRFCVFRVPQKEKKENSNLKSQRQAAGAKRAKKCWAKWNCWAQMTYSHSSTIRTCINWLSRIRSDIQTVRSLFDSPLNFNRNICRPYYRTTSVSI